jgi:hypothetical protein
LIHWAAQDVPDVAKQTGKHHDEIGPTTDRAIIILSAEWGTRLHHNL